ncbi:NAD-dependent deacetylase [Flavobacterium endophyticum]|uniref:NAD-dependent protein deacylase n=1 Tax=Flavobacterium endophyticum TaxID=1540163 RepID=A0A495MGY8_9FLAO|nr:NAD-dependent deacylase [Flavobacterium endophyticum]RKS25216.1 NAD-dependent deacetylase [Flavobacterium endophyticum]
MKKKLVVLTGAGISAESGIKTFRDSDGLWEGHDVMEVASPEGWRNNPALVMDFYNKRRQQLKKVVPNAAHLILAELEQHFDVHIITQNVDDLHERAGSSNVLHLHGELLKARSTKRENYILDWTDDLNFGDLDDNGHQLRPHIVWFGEAVPALEEAISITNEADFFAVVGTSLQVYPAAGLVDFAKPGTPLFYVDLNPARIPNLRNELEVIPTTASEGMKLLKEKLLARL